MSSSLNRPHKNRTHNNVNPRWLKRPPWWLEGMKTAYGIPLVLPQRFASIKGRVRKFPMATVTPSRPGRNAAKQEVRKKKKKKKKKPSSSGAIVMKFQSFRAPRSVKIQSEKSSVPGSGVEHCFAAVRSAFSFFLFPCLADKTVPSQVDAEKGLFCALKDS